MNTVYRLSNFGFVLLLFFGSLHVCAQTGIGTTAPNAAAKLEIASTDKGLLIPRMTKAQREAITLTAAANGLMVYQTDGTAGLYYYNGSAWIYIIKSTSNV